VTVPNDEVRPTVVSGDARHSGASSYSTGLRVELFASVQEFPTVAHYR
jgi:hypothetical protein